MNTKDSIGDRDVTIEDHHEISNEMKKWIKRIKDFNSHISKAVSTVKNQAVRLGLILQINYPDYKIISPFFR